MLKFHDKCSQGLPVNNNIKKKDFDFPTGHFITGLEICKKLEDQF
jgi:hypothetical protein